MRPITPQLIPHEDFHKGIWLLPIKRPRWYYFMEKQNNHDVTAPAFLQSVDTPLRELVKFLHSIGLKTTPSCAGHHYHEDIFEKIYDDLEKDKCDIRKSGIKLKDVETGRLYLYCDKHYVLPWKRNNFLKEAVEYQHEGILGVDMNGFRKAKAEILNLRLAGVKVEEKDATLFIHTQSDENRNRGLLWEQITYAVKDILQKNRKPGCL